MKRSLFLLALALSLVAYSAAFATDYYVSANTGHEAEITSANHEPFSLANGDTLTLKVDRGPEQTVQFVTDDFASIGAALASEVVWVINSRATGITATIVGGYVRIRSNRADTTATIQITGGTSNVKFGFPTDEFTSEATQLHPLKSISSAIRVAPGTQSDPANIRVAGGTYRENVVMKDYVNLLGGYEVETWTRDITSNETIISYAVWFNNVKSGSLEGFTVKNGSAVVFCENSSVAIRNNVIANSTSGYGLLCENNSTVVIEHNTVRGNSGTGIFIGWNCTAMIQGNIVRGNLDGGIGCYAASATITNNIICSNSVTNTGGGISCDASTATIEDNVIIGNSAGGGGGMLCHNSIVTVQRNIISGNRGWSDGAGIYCNLNSSATIRNNIICGNQASFGAGIRCYDSSPIIESNIISGNTVDAGGGGIECYYRSSPVIESNTIVGNSATKGGGVFSWEYSSPTLKNNLFHENVGYDVYEHEPNYQSDVRAYFNEFYGSTPAIWRDEGTTDLTTIGQVNALSDAEDNISVPPEFMPMLARNNTGVAYDPSTFQSTLTDVSATFSPGALVGLLLNPDTSQYRQFPIASNTETTITVWGDILSIATTGDPYKVFDYHLSSSSGLIDAGADLGAARRTDINGEWRPRGAGFDIGADEYLGPATDTDNDGTPDLLDTDDDGDGMPDLFEEENSFNPVNPSDGLLDPDNDGLSNAGEYEHQTNLYDSDTDDDGIPDGWEVQNSLNPLDGGDAASDADSDGLTNLSEFLHNSSPNDSDTDHDGMPDLFEVDHQLNPANASDAAQDADSDRLSNVSEYEHQTSLTDPDTDDDGLLDGWEVNYGFNPLQPDNADLDPDGDGLSNLVESQYNSDPNDTDTDDDGMSDAFEVENLLNPTNAADALSDADSDGLSNIDEHNRWTNLRNPDTDSDGMRDGWEVQHGLNPLDGNDAALDPDDDGLTNLAEFQRDSNPNDPDSDNDGMWDGWEVLHGLNLLAGADSTYDSDADGLVNLAEFQHTTDPRSADTDSDSMPDGWEVQHSLNPLDNNDRWLDSDGDGLMNFEEWARGNDPQDANSPPAEFYVDAGVPPGGTGTQESPFASIPEAMIKVRPTATYWAGLHLAPGVYTQFLLLMSGTRLYGSGPDATIINAGDVEVTVRAAQNTAVENLTITTSPAATGTVHLLKIEDVSCAVRDVVFDGKNAVFSVGVLISGALSSTSVISGCTFERMTYGVRAVNTGAVITECTFDDIETTAIFIRPPSVKERRTLDDLLEEVPLLGDVSAAESTGHNDFSLLANDSKFIDSTSSQTIRAQLNEWGPPTADQIRARIRSTGEVIVEPFLYQGQVVGGEGEEELEGEVEWENGREGEADGVEAERDGERESEIAGEDDLRFEEEPLPEPDAEPEPFLELEPEPSEGETEIEEPGIAEDAIEEEQRPEPEPELEPGEGEVEEHEGEREEGNPSPQPTAPVINLCPTAHATVSTGLAVQLEWIRDWRDELLANRLGEKAVAAYYRSK